MGLTESEWDDINRGHEAEIERVVEAETAALTAEVETLRDIEQAAKWLLGCPTDEEGVYITFKDANGHINSFSIHRWDELKALLWPAQRSNETDQSGGD